MVAVEGDQYKRKMSERVPKFSSNTVCWAQVIKDTAGSVTNIPEATANSLGSAFKTLASYSEGGYLAVKHLTLENLRQLHKISAEGFSAVKHFSSNSLTSVRSFSAGILTPVEGFWEGGLSSVHHLTMGGLASVGRFSLENYLALKRGAEGGVATLKHSSVEGLRSTLQVCEPPPPPLPLPTPLCATPHQDVLSG